MEHFWNRDVVDIWLNMQHHQKIIFHKRKFLMGLLDVGNFDQNLRLHGGKLSTLPESLLRKDDVFYEDVKSFVEKGFRACDAKARQSIIDDEDELLCDVHNISRYILTLVDDLSNNGLWCLAKILTRGSVSFYKTRPQMKRVIKNSLKVQSNWLDSNRQGQLQNQLSQLLRNPNNFCQNHRKYIKLTRKSLLHALEKVNFQALPVRILFAMYRKLKGTEVFNPQVTCKHYCWNKGRLISLVIKLFKKMIYQHDESDTLQYPLNKAMDVPSLYSKIASNYLDHSMVKFVLLPPEVEALQNEIIKAIQTLEKSFKTEELKNLQLLLNPSFEVGVNGLKKAIKATLIDCLFGCNDMEAVPDSLLKALSCINKKSCKVTGIFSKEVIEEEVERILDVGAHMKQLMWDNLPLDQLDQDFADVYMEELEESDDGDIFGNDDQQLHTNFLDEVQSRLNDFSEEVASASVADDVGISSATSTLKDKLENANEFASSPSFRGATFTDHNHFRDTKISGDELKSTGSPPLVSPMLPVKDEVMDSQDPPTNTSVYSVNLAKMCSKQNQMSGCLGNNYVAVQEVCDQASLVAYRLIGHVLAEFGQMEGLSLNLDDDTYLRGACSRSDKFQDSNSMDECVSGSIIVQAVNEVIPSFPNSQLEIVKKFMNS